MIENVEQAREKYIERFGGFPDYLLMGASDEYVIWKVRVALRTDREIEPDEPDAKY